jgi:hypothetical protein
LAKRLTGKASRDSFAYLEAVVGSASGDDSVPLADFPSASSATEDQKLLHQVAPSAAEVPLPEMTELLITPQMPEYPKIAHDVFHAIAGWQVAVRGPKISKYLKPLAPPPPTAAHQHRYAVGARLKPLQEPVQRQLRQRGRKEVKQQLRVQRLPHQPWSHPTLMLPLQARKRQWFRLRLQRRWRPKLRLQNPRRRNLIRTKRKHPPKKSAKPAGKKK